MDTLGLTLGAYTQESRRQQEQNRQEEVLGLQKAAGARQEEQFGWQRGEQGRAQQSRVAFETLKQQHGQMTEALRDTGRPENQKLLTELARANGTNLEWSNGNAYSVGVGPDGKQMVSPVKLDQIAQFGNDQFMNALAMQSPEAYAQREGTQYGRRYTEGRDAAKDAQWEKGYEQTDRQFEGKMGLGRDELELRRQIAAQDNAVRREQIAASRARTAQAAGPKISKEDQDLAVALARAVNAAEPGSDEQMRLKQEIAVFELHLRGKYEGKLAFGAEQMMAGARGLPPPIMGEFETQTSDGKGTLKYKAPVGQGDPVTGAALDAASGRNHGMLGVKPKELPTQSAPQGGGFLGGLMPTPRAEAAPPATAAATAQDWGLSPNDFDFVVQEAQRGSRPHVEQLMFWVNSGELSMGKRLELERMLAPQ